MISCSLADHPLLISTYSDLQQKLEKASDDISLLSETLKPHLNVEYFIELLQQCCKVIHDSKTLSKLYEEGKEDKIAIEQSLMKRKIQIEKLSEDNHSLSVLMEEMKIQFENQLTDMVKTTAQNEQVLAIQTKMQIEAFQRANRSQIQAQIVSYLKIVCEKDKIIEELTKKLQLLSNENELKMQEIQLAEMAVQDLWEKSRQSEIVSNRNELWQTYSPSLNRSNSLLELQSQPSNQLNKRRSSLMQDLYESHIQYQEPFSSKFQISKQTIEQFEQYRPPKASESTSRRVSPTSVFSNQICINCTLKTIAESASVSMGTQTYCESISSKLYNSLKTRIVDARIKKR